MGRRSQCTPETTQKVVRALRAGSFFEIACRYAGISERTGYSWNQRGRDALALAAETGKNVPRSEQPFVRFLQAVEDAEAQTEIELVGLLMARAKQGDMRAADILLKKRFRGRWQDSQLQETRSLDVDPVEKAAMEKLSAMSDDELLALAQGDDE